MSGNHAKVQARKARKNVLAAGQGARKKKPHGKRRGIGSKRHRRALRV